MSIAPPPQSVALLDPAGLVAYPWYSFFRDTYTFLQGPHVVASTAAGQTIENNPNPLIIIVYGTKTLDTHGSFNAATGVFTCPITGWYEVGASLAWATVAWGVTKTTYIAAYRNDAVKVVLDHHVTEGGVTKRLMIGGSTTMYLEKDDTLDIRIFHDRGSDTDMYNSAPFNNLSIHRVL